MTGGAAVRLGLYPLTKKGQQATAAVVSAFREAQRQVADERTSGSDERKGDVGKTDDADVNDGSPVDRAGRAEVLRRARALIRADPNASVSPLWMFGGY